MFWYLLNILGITIAWFSKTPTELLESSSEIGSHIKLRKKRVCIVATLNWILLSGLRSLNVGADTLAYKINRFDVTMNRSFSDIFADFYLKYVCNTDIKDPGYTLLEKIFQIFTTNYTIWLFFIAIVFMVPLGVLVYKYSDNPYLSYIVYSTLFYSFFSITGHRQTIATALVVLMGCGLIKKRQLIAFLIVVAIASTIHASAVCFLPFYWISKIKINRITIGLYWILIVCAFAFRYQFLSILQTIVGYEQYQQSDGASAGTFMFLLISLAVFISAFWRHLKIVRNSLIEMSIDALFVACIFSSLLLINQAFMRVVQYYSLFIMFLLPQCHRVFTKESQPIFNYIVSLIMIGLLIKGNPTYLFIWQ